MNKRLEKRHKRKVSRARSQVRLSEPDVRTPEQLRAAREESRAVPGRLLDPHANYSTPPSRQDTGPDGDGKADG